MIWIIIFLFLFIGLTGLMVDTANVALVAHQLQNAADAAALGGAMYVKINQEQARQTALDTALANIADHLNVHLDAGDIVIGRYSRSTSEFTPTTTYPNALKVTAKHTDTSIDGPVNLIFGPIFGVNTSNVSRYAIAITSGGTGAGMIVLDTDEKCALTVNGSPVVNVNGGAIQVNSENSEAVCVIGTSATTTAPELNVCGDVRFTGNSEFDGLLNPKALPIDDPLGSYSEPIWSSTPDQSDTVSKITEGVHVLEPGFYSEGIEATGGNITMKPGMYFLEGAGFNIAGNTNLCAKGVFLFVHTGKVDITGTGSIVISPMDMEMTPADFCDPGFSYPVGTDFTYEDITIFQARDNEEDARITGTSLMDLEGTLYFPSNHVKLDGTGDGFGTQLIANTIEIGGTGEITINYDGRNPAPGLRSILVE